MNIKMSVRKVMAKAWEILLVSALLAAGVGIGSMLTQYQLKMPVDLGLIAQLMGIFFLIVAFGGAVFAIVASRHIPTR
jgi:succinate dehydrogenase hydrophobic anchor subunit